MTRAPDSPAPVAIVGGSGALGSALALRLAIAGVPILLGSRDEGRAAEAAARLAARLPEGAPSPSPGGNAEVVAGAEVILLCVPFRSHSETFTNLRDHLRAGQLLIDATVPLAAAISGKATRTIGVWQGSAAQQALEMAPDGVRVVSALHTVSAKTLADTSAPLAEDVLVCGDRKADKREAAGLLQRIDGLRVVDAGPLEQSRIVEQLTATLIGINVRYRTHAGIRITGLPDDLWPTPSEPSPTSKEPR
ncbi:MAG: NADPH-dependent F420 reductase [Solirubrobacteraceae bacterium]|nr:NADPH-dependent F420 reductase [Solirubrobacteraceae bacterium]